jgi:hypothetical protein
VDWNYKIFPEDRVDRVRDGYAFFNADWADRADLCGSDFLPGEIDQLIGRIDKRFTSLFPAFRVSSWSQILKTEIIKPQRQAKQSSNKNIPLDIRSAETRPIRQIRVKKSVAKKAAADPRHSAVKSSAIRAIAIFPRNKS